MIINRRIIILFLKLGLVYDMFVYGSGGELGSGDYFMLVYEYY